MGTVSEAMTGCKSESFSAYQFRKLKQHRKIFRKAGVTDAYGNPCLPLWYIYQTSAEELTKQFRRRGLNQKEIDQTWEALDDFLVEDEEEGVEDGTL